MDLSSHFFDDLVGASFNSFSSSIAVTKFQGELLRGGYTGKHRPLSRKRFEIDPELLWNTNRKSQVADHPVPVPVTLNDLERRDVKGQTFLEDFRNYAPIV